MLSQPIGATVLARPLALWSAPNEKHVRYEGQRWAEGRLKDGRPYLGGGYRLADTPGCGRACDGAMAAHGHEDSTMDAITIGPPRRRHAAERPARRTMTGRVKRVLASIVALLVAVLAYGVGIEPHLILSIDRQAVVLPHLSTAWDGQRVAATGDFHVGMWLDNSDMARRAIQQIVTERPAAVFLLGDFIYEPSNSEDGEMDTLVQLLRPLALAHLPTYAVLGNHDYGVRGGGTRPQPQVAARLRRALAQLGIQVLENRAVALAPPAGRAPRLGAGPTPLYVVGLGPHDADEDRPGLALHSVPATAPRIVLMHDPESFILLPAGSAPLGIAAHTHCGQVRLPIVTSWVLALAEGHRVAADGWNTHYGQVGNRLYITCGIGMSVVPLRIGDPPQVTIFTLHRA